MDIWQAISAGLVGLCIGLVLVALGRLPDSRLIRPLLCVILTVALWSLGELVAAYEQVRVVLVNHGPEPFRCSEVHRFMSIGGFCAGATRPHDNRSSFPPPRQRTAPLLSCQLLCLLW